MKLNVISVKSKTLDQVEVLINIEAIRNITLNPKTQEAAIWYVGGREYTIITMDEYENKLTPFMEILRIVPHE